LPNIIAFGHDLSDFPAQYFVTLDFSAFSAFASRITPVRRIGCVMSGLISHSHAIGMPNFLPFPNPTTARKFKCLKLDTQE